VQTRQTGAISQRSVIDLGAFAEGIREVISQWGKVYVLGNNGKVHYTLTNTLQVSCLKEKLTFAKLHMLYHKSLYVLALNMAMSQCGRYT
jgi:hypothetical protein